MKLTDLIPAFAAHKSKTDTALESHKAALATANETILQLSAEVAALKASTAKAADEDSDSDTSDDNSELDQFVSDLQALISKYTSDESEDGDSDSDSDSDTSDDSDSSDDSDDSNDESSKATRADKLKSIAKSVTKIVADNKKLKSELPKQVIRELATVGIPTPIATKPDGQKPQLTGRARVAAAFNEQLKK